jgi:hypothetical protein
MSDKEKAQQLGITVTQMGNKWYANKDGTTIAIEMTEALAYACAIARAEAGVF